MFAPAGAAYKGIFAMPVLRSNNILPLSRLASKKASRVVVLPAVLLDSLILAGDSRVLNEPSPS